jgi:hypothetical protein
MHPTIAQRFSALTPTGQPAASFAVMHNAAFPSAMGWGLALRTEGARMWRRDFIARG